LDDAHTRSLLQELGEESEQLKNQLREQNNQLKKYKEIVNKLKEQNPQLSEEMNQLREQNNQLKKYKEKVNKLKEQNSQLSEEMNQLRDDFNSEIQQSFEKQESELKRILTSVLERLICLEVFSAAAEISKTQVQVEQNIQQA
ncbi:4247_t:CDS:2, partial [Entrophospora sp. SA101]